ncbi:MAG: esterase family protein, partial [Bacillota bacterium]|nr:esterase family protein [Bacillota bacterium]
MAPKNDTVQEKKFFSKELNEEMTLLVYLPSN